VVADEPTGSLDSVTTEAMLAVFKDLTSEGKTVLIVTHDEDIARGATRAITLADGAIVDEGR
jgi:putative ABC transport system ATP-binding protein